MSIWTDEVKAVELEQQIRAYVPELEQRVAETKNETNRYEKLIALEMKKWLGSDAVIDLASIKKKRRKFEELAIILKIDDQADSERIIRQ